MRAIFELDRSELELTTRRMANEYALTTKTDDDVLDRCIIALFVNQYAYSLSVTKIHKYMLIEYSEDVTRERIQKVLTKLARAQFLRRGRQSTRGEATYEVKFTD